MAADSKSSSSLYSLSQLLVNFQFNIIWNSSCLLKNKTFIYSRYYDEACNQWRFRLHRLAPGQHRNVAAEWTVGDVEAALTGQGIEPLTSAPNLHLRHQSAGPVIEFPSPQNPGTEPRHRTQPPNPTRAINSRLNDLRAKIDYEISMFITSLNCYKYLLWRIRGFLALPMAIHRSKLIITCFIIIIVANFATLLLFSNSFCRKLLSNNQDEKRCFSYDVTLSFLWLVRFVSTTLHKNARDCTVTSQHLVNNNLTCQRCFFNSFTLAVAQSRSKGSFTRATTVVRLHFLEDIFEDARLY